MKPLFKKIDCLSLPVGNFDEALAFYRDALGHDLIWRDENAVGLGIPGSTSEIVLHLDKRPIETDLEVDSVPEAIERFCRSGGGLISGPFDIRIGLCAIVRDPWNNPLVILDSSKGALKTNQDGRIVGNLPLS